MANRRALVKELVKLGLTLVVLVGIFVEVGGGRQAADMAAVCATSGFEKANPDYPGLVGRLKAKARGLALPAPRVPAAAADLCDVEGAVFAPLADGRTARIRPWHHCTDGKLDRVYDEAGASVPLATACAQPTPTGRLRIQGFQLVPMDLAELWAEVTALDPMIFVPWMLAATLIKLLGILANVVRWQVLLRGQGIELAFGHLAGSYFVGRYFGIVTPGTLGLDGYRLYDTITLTGRPVECTTAIAIERVIGAVGLLLTIVLFMPFAGDLLHGQSFGELVGAMRVPLVFGALLATLLVLQPRWFEPVLGLLPARAHGLARKVLDAATAYQGRRSYLVIALAMAVIGQVTTTLMYFCNAMAIHTASVSTMEVLFASAVMTLGTFVAPSASGEGVREAVFVWLLGNKAGAAKAFLIGHLGFWIEKIPLSVPGALFLFWDPGSYKRATREDLERATKAPPAAP